MAQLKTHLDVLKLLPQTNCRRCNQATCLAFAVMVMQGSRQLGDCPCLEASAAEAVEVATRGKSNATRDVEEALSGLRQAVCQVDLSEAAPRLGCDYKNGKATVSCLGRDFQVDAQGMVTSLCHINGWVVGPILDYLAHGQGQDPTGEWLPLRDLKGGDDWWRLFGQRCEKPLKKVIDGYTGLMEDMVDIFAADPAPELFDSDIAVVLHPLPKVPILLCYWKPEDGMESQMHMFFDASVQKNLSIDSLYTLGAGMAIMFEKIARNHGN